MPVDVFLSSGDEGPSALRDDAALMLNAVGEVHAELSVLLCDDGAIRELNRTWRGVDQATDVLSFPQGDDNPPGAPRALGDIVISLDTAASQASELGHSVEVELRVLLAHGLLHLLGHDHDDQDDRAAMEAEEQRLLLSVGLDGEGLVRRAQGPAVG